MKQLTILGITLIVLLSPFRASAEQFNSAGEFEFKQDDGHYQPAILLNTAISGEINGLIASLTITQRFQNTTDEWLNGRYVFPMPDGASVDSLTITIGERVIVGLVKEKLAAKKVFEQAKREGKKAALLEQHRPNLFSLSVANIEPQSIIRTQITYVEKVHYESGLFSLRLPTTLTPRYVPGVPIGKGIEHEFHGELKEGEALEAEGDLDIAVTGWAQNTDVVADAKEVTPGQIHQGDLQLDEPASSHHFSLSLQVDAGMPLDQLLSPYHSIDHHLVQDNQYAVTLSNGTAAMDRDLLLRWKPMVGSDPQAAVFKQQIDNEYYSMVMLMPPQIDVASALPRDVTFIVDSSGSMAGASMPQAKASLLQALSHLSQNDRFNIIDFDSTFTPLFENSIAVSARSLRQARNMIKGIQADGGTEMFGALQYALNRQRSENTLNQIIFITDGSIANERQLFELIHQNLGDARLFTVGIGSAPNSYFMRKAAKFGRGSYTYVGADDQAIEVMDALFGKITRPILRDLTIDLPADVEFYPQRIPDLYAAEPVMMLAKSKHALGTVEIRGSLLGKQWQRRLNLPSSQTNTDNAENLDALWARDKIAHLMEQMISGDLTEDQAKPLITELGVKHQLLTRYTSFVAVDKRPSRPLDQKAKHKNVPNLMPAGSTMAAPQTATPATLMAIFGVLLLLLASTLRKIDNVRVVR